MVGNLKAGRIDAGKYTFLICTNWVLSQLLLQLFKTLGFSLAMTYERSQVISNSFPIDNAYTVLAIKNPEDAISFMAYLDPMKPLTWIIVGIVCLVCPLFLTLAAKYKQLSTLQSST